MCYITSTQLLTTHMLVAVSESPGAPRASTAHCASLLLFGAPQSKSSTVTSALPSFYAQGGNSTSTSTPSYPEEGVHSMHTRTSGAAVLCPHCPAQGLCKCPASHETATLPGNTPLHSSSTNTAPPGCVSASNFSWGRVYRSVFLLFDKLALHISSLVKIN